MRSQLYRWSMVFGLASQAMLGAAHQAAAQPEVRDHRGPRAPKPAPPPEPTPAPDAHRRRGHDEGPREAPPAPREEPPPIAGGPRDEPPPPRDESPAAKAGFVWVAGHWDWRATKYEWVAGHYERERAGKDWREGRWDRKGDTWAYVDGEWVDHGAPAPQPPVPQPPDRRPDRRPPRVWKLEGPVVGSYWPVKGKVGTRVMIRGRSFPADAQVVWGDEVLRGAKVTPELITLVVPANAATGTIALRAGRGRDLAVGSFEVAAAYDAAADQKKLDEERRRRAEADWTAHQKELAKDRAAREAAMQQREQERAASREQRRADRAAEIRAKFARDFLSSPEAQAELTLHAQRAAELDRMREVADVSSDGKLAVRIDVARAREDERHEQRMATLQSTFQAK
jgi:hypothetical protein